MDAPLPTAPATDPEKQDIEQNKDLAAFSYLWIMSVIVFFLRRNSPFVRFHSKQAMVLFFLSVLVWFIPFVGRLLELVILCLMVFGFINAAQGLRKDVPVIGPLSRCEITVRQAWQQIVDAAARIVKSLRSHKIPPTSPSPLPPSSSPPNPNPNP